MVGRPAFRVLSAVSIFVLSGPTRSAVAQTETPRLAWRIVDYAMVPSRVLQLADVEAERMYNTIGVDMRIEREPASDAVRTVTVIILDAHRADQKDLPAPTLGSAPGTPTKRGVIAYILYDRVEHAARRHTRAVGELLGLVIAHEIGHLLLPYNAHAPNSIMQANWDSAFMMSAPGIAFTPDQAALIRSELAEPVADRALLSDNR
jgi:hypothetical protein